MSILRSLRIKYLQQLASIIERVMLVSILFCLLFAGSAILTWANGFFTEKIFTVILLVMVIIPPVLHRSMSWELAQRYVFFADATLLLITLAIVKSTQSYWPIWFAAFQTITVATGLAQFIYPNLVPGIYIMASGFWSLPAIGAFVVGVLCDKRRRDWVRIKAPKIRLP